MKKAPYDTSLNVDLAKYREGVAPILASCMVNALAFFDAILQDLMQDAAFSFAKMYHCFLL